MAGYPVYSADIANLTFGTGANKKWHPGIGIGGSIITSAAGWEHITKRIDVDTISSNGFNVIKVDTINTALSFFAPYLRLITPLSDIQLSDKLFPYYPQVFHLFLSGCAWESGTGWGNKYLLIGGGLDFCFPVAGLPIKFGIEAGYLQRWQKQNITYNSYIGLKLGISGWIPRNVTPEIDVKIRWPSKIHEISSPFGHRYRGQKREFHKGIDIPIPIGTPILSAASGIVEFVGIKRGYGYCILIRHSKKLETFYGHINKIIVKKKQYIKSGQVIAYSGETGLTTGPHLHFEVRLNGKPVDPEKYLTDR